MTARRREVHRPGVSYLTPGEVADELRVSKMTVYRLIHSGQLDAIRVGRSFRVTEKAFDAYRLAAEGLDWEPSGGVA